MMLLPALNQSSYHKNHILKTVHEYFKNELEQMNFLIQNRISSRTPLISDVVSCVLSTPGKHLRPLLTLLCGNLGVCKQERTVQLATCMELIHMATLFHDDVIDNSSCRRSQPTAHTIWGNKISILVGDFLLSQAFDIMTHDESRDILHIFSKTVSDLTEGEIKQLESKLNTNFSKENYLVICGLKTASLFAACCTVGGYGGALSNDQIQALHRFGYNFGMAFQLQDDLNDYSEIFKTEGKDIKSVGNDFKEGLITLPLILTFENGTLEEKILLKESIQQKGENPTLSLTETIVLMDKYGVQNQIKLIIQSFIEKSKESLTIFPASPHRDFLNNLSDINKFF